MPPSLDEIRTFAGDRLAGFKLPRRLDAIPRTAATHQVQRHLVLALIS